nr:hypothetical protein [uncultured Agathobaculum sp.]
MKTSLKKALTQLGKYGILIMAVEKLPCTVHIFIPTILLLALFRKEGRIFYEIAQNLSDIEE